MSDRPTPVIETDSEDLYEVLLYPDAKVENHGTIARAEVVLDGVDRWIVAEPRMLRDALLGAISAGEPVVLVVPGWALS